jgi:hypothetical protein
MAALWMTSLATGEGGRKPLARASINQTVSALIFFHRDAGYIFDQKHRVIARTWVGKDEKGFNLMLQALPLDGKIVLRQYEGQPGEIRTVPASKPRRKAPRQ